VPTPVSQPLTPPIPLGQRFSYVETPENSTCMSAPALESFSPGGPVPPVPTPRTRGFPEALGTESLNLLPKRYMSLTTDEASASNVSKQRLRVRAQSAQSSPPLL